MKYAFRCFYYLIFFLLLCDNVFALLIMPESIDFGRVKKFYQSKRYIFFKNDSDENVEILGIVNACGLALKLDKKLIRPNEVTEGVLFFDSGSPQGSFEEYVKIVLKKGERLEERKIKVVWYTYPDKYPEIIIERKEFDLGEILPKTQVPFQFRVTNTGNMVLTINAVIKEGFLVSLPVDIQPNETKMIKGTIVIENPEKATKTLVLETNDLSNPKIEIKFHYDARWDIKRGVNFYLEKTKRVEGGFEIPLRISSKDYDISDIILEDIDGKKLSFKKDKDILFKNEEGVFLIRLTDIEYEKLIKGKLFIKFGIPIED